MPRRRVIVWLSGVALLIAVYTYSMIDATQVVVGTMYPGRPSASPSGWMVTLTSQRGWLGIGHYSEQPPISFEEMHHADREFGAAEAYWHLRWAGSPQEPGLGIYGSYRLWRFAGFHYFSHPPQWGYFSDTRILVIPYWFPLVLSLTPLVPIWRRARRAAKVRAGVCLGCGYDLRATPERCPECGIAPPFRSAGDFARAL